MPEETVQTVSLRLKDGYQFEASFEKFPGVPPVLLDEPTPLGESRGPNAAALVAAAVGDCLSASLLFCLRKSRVEVAGMTAHVTAQLVRNEKGRLRIGAIDVRIEPETISAADQARLDRCRELFEDFCVVTESVRRGIEVNVSVEPKQARASIG